VFISYARKDGASLAHRLQSDLTKQGFDVWLDKRRITGGASWTIEIETALDGANYILALLTSGSFASEICRAEQLRSLRKGKCVIPLLAQRGADIPLHLEAKHYRDFTGDQTYANSLGELLGDIYSGNGVALKQEFRQTYVTMPPLPVNYVDRPEAIAALRDALITDDGGRHIALTALEGMGGIGKTILAQALCHLEVVQQAFPDGVIWITVGKEPAFDALTRMREVGRVLGDDISLYDTELGATNRYRSTIRGKAALIVVDDVWRVSDLEPLLAESSPRSRLLFTTRDGSIAAAVGAREQVVDLLSQDQSREVLARGSGTQMAKLPPIANDLIHECGRLPLALSMMGAMLRGKPLSMWTRVRDLLRDVDLKTIKGQFPNYPYTDIFRAIQVSVDALDPTSQERYIALAVLPEEMAVAVPVQQCLWGLDEGKAVETAQMFVTLSLAQRAQPEGSILLHDLQLDYARAQHPDREALDLIHGALRLSSHIIAQDPAQFASQLVGRLLAYVQPGGPLPAKQQFARLVAKFAFRQEVFRGNNSTVQEITDLVVKAAPRPWLRPLQPALYPPGGGLVRTLEGLSYAAWSVAVSEDGRRAVSASDDRTVKVWDLEKGRELRTLAIDFPGPPWMAMAVAGDGRRAVCNSSTAYKVWDLETGRELRTLACEPGLFPMVAMSADGHRAVTCSSDNMLKVWDLETGRELRTLTGHPGKVWGISVSWDGGRAVSASDDTLKVWDLETGRELRTLAADFQFYECMNSVAMSGDGRRAVSGTSRTMTAWDLETGRELRIDHGHLPKGELDGVSCLALSGDGRRAVSVAPGDPRLKVWDLETGLELRTLTGHSAGVRSASLTPDGRLIVSASWDGTLKVWDPGTGSEARSLTGHRSAVLRVAASADGRRAVSASDWALKVWDLETGRELRTMAGDSSLCESLAVSGDGRRAISPYWHGTFRAHLLGRTGFRLKLWNVRTGRKLRTVAGHAEMVRAVALSEDGRQAVSASDDNTLKVWDLKTGRELYVLAGHSEVVNDVAVSGDGRRAVSASKDSTLKVWDLETSREVHTLTGHSSGVSSVAVSRDGRRAVSASAQETMLKVWDLETGREIHTLAGHSAGVNGVAVSGDGRRAVSASEDHTLKVWYLEAGELVATFTCDAPARCCSFASRSRIVAGDLSGRVHFLSLEEPVRKG
jgi:WD40 repeat protein